MSPLLAGPSSPRVAIDRLTFGAGLLGCVVQADPEERFRCSSNMTPKMDLGAPASVGMNPLQQDAYVSSTY
jgi:hypothetical protein